MFRFKDTSSLSQLILLVIITLATWLIISIAATLIGSLIWNLDLFNNTQSLADAPGFARYFQIIQSFALFVLPPLFFAFITQEFPLPWLRFKIPSQRNLVLSIIIVLIAQPLVSYLGYLNNIISFPEYFSNIEEWMRIKENEALKMTEIFLDTSGFMLLILNIFIIAIIPAIGEELLFRGAIQKLITAITKNYHISILITAFLFSAMHMQFFGFFPRFFLGIIFGYLVVYGKSIWLSIAAHFTNNFTAFIIYNLSTSNGNISENPLTVNDKHPNLFFVTLSMLGVFAIILFISKKQKANSI